MTSMGPGSRLQIRRDPQPHTHLPGPTAGSLELSPGSGARNNPFWSVRDPAQPNTWAHPPRSRAASNARRRMGCAAAPGRIPPPPPRSGATGAESDGLGRSIAAQRGMRSRAEFLRSIAGATRWERRRRGTGRRWGHGRIRPPRGSGAARVPAPGAHLLLQLLHLLLVRQLRLLQHPPLRRLLLQELDFPAGRRSVGARHRGGYLCALLGAGRWGGGCWGYGCWG